MTVIFPIETQDQRAIVACGIVFSFLPAIVVGLRVLARRKANRLLDTSDYLIITSGVCWKIAEKPFKKVSSLMSTHLHFRSGSRRYIPGRSYLMFVFTLAYSNVVESITYSSNTL